MKKCFLVFSALLTLVVSDNVSGIATGSASVEKRMEPGMLGSETLSCEMGGKSTVIINFSGTERASYRIGVDEGKYKVIFSSDSVKFGGEDKFTKRVFNHSKKGANGKPCSIVVDMNRFSSMILQKIR